MAETEDVVDQDLLDLLDSPAWRKLATRMIREVKNKREAVFTADPGTSDLAQLTSYAKGGNDSIMAVIAWAYRETGVERPDWLKQALAI